MSSKIYLIDAYGVCYRAFYAVRALTNSKGQPTNAVFGFCNILRKLLREHKPTHIAMCFDLGKQTHRQKKFADYKVQRQAMPDDLVSQIEVIRDVIKAYNLPIYALEGYEADDVLGTIARKLAKKGQDVFVVTDDKDMSQLIDEHITIYSARQDKMIREPEVREKYGIEPSQMVDYIALNGDASDNIPGVYGIGEVTAKKLINAYGSIENIYKNIDSITPEKLKEKLVTGKEQAYLSKELATLHCNVPIDVNLDDIKVREPNTEALRQLFMQLEFRKFAEDLTTSESEPLEDEFPAENLKKYVSITEDNQPIHIVYDLKAQLKSKALELGQLKGEVFDVFLADYLLSQGQGQYHLPTLRRSDEGMRQLYQVQKALIKDQGISQLFYDIETPLLHILLKMEQEGVQLDLNVLKELSTEGSKKIAELEEQLFKLAGGQFNVNSPKQLSEVLFERLQLPVVKKTKTGFSTDEEVLTKLAAKHPLPALILEYRQMAKLKSTYIDALPQLVDGNFRVHASFNQTGAETGRLSSNNPNLQNIPIRNELGRRIRKAFVAYSPDHILLSADYSQIELRILAHLSGDENLVKAFKEEADIHRYTASLMFDVSEDKVDDQMRYAAKRINFGIVYGMSPFGLSKDLNISTSQAHDFIDRYFLRYPKVRGFLDGEIQKARDLGYVTTMFNRRRYLPDINNRNMGLRQFAERQAINAPMQGTAADLIKVAMVNINKAIEEAKLSSNMILTVHDELVFNVKKQELNEMLKIVCHNMEHALELSVPIKVSMKKGPNWYDMEKVSPSK